ncbi:MAG: hypothetical protein ACT4OM_13955 [Actinomycetota bacterium]
MAIVNPFEDTLINLTEEGFAAAILAEVGFEPLPLAARELCPASAGIYVRDWIGISVRNHPPGIGVRIEPDRALRG